MKTAENREPPQTAETPLSREAYGLLAQANLLRMRGHWDDAVDRCMAALRLAPESASAQSLLGDIYENQGRYDDAIQWYRMALDINPDSPADKIKLERLLSADPRRRWDRSDLSRRPAPALETLQPAPERSHSNPDAERVLRGVAWLAAALFLVAAVLSGVVMAKHRPSGGPITAPAVVVSTPAPPPTDVDTPANSDTNASGGTVATSMSPPATSLPAAADPAESALLQSLQQDSGLAALNVVPVSVEIDPRQNSAAVTALCPLPAAGASVRDALLRDAAQAVLAGSRAPGNSLAAWTVRCLMPAPGSSSGSSSSAPSLAFVADTTSAAAATLGPDVASLPTPSLLNAFRNVWWSPAVTQ